MKLYTPVAVGTRSLMTDSAVIILAALAVIEKKAGVTFDMTDFSPFARMIVEVLLHLYSWGREPVPYQKSFAIAKCPATLLN